MTLDEEPRLSSREHMWRGKEGGRKGEIGRETGRARVTSLENKGERERGRSS